MARITVEDCLENERNRFALVQLAAKRAKQLLNGAKARISDTRGNKSIVVALREIAAGEVRFMTEEEMAKSLTIVPDGVGSPVVNRSTPASEVQTEPAALIPAGIADTNGDDSGGEHRRTGTLLPDE